MKTLIKWPGGKSREYNNIASLIPDNIDKYIEPFFGGGAIYFKLEPRKALINDINHNLMSFYQYIKNDNSDFKNTLLQISDDWNNLSKIALQVFDAVNKYKNNVNEMGIRKDIEKLSKNKSLPKLINGQEKFWLLLSDDLINKLNKIVKLEVKNGTFNKRDFYNQIVAVTKGTYYYYLRDKFLPKHREESVAQFFFLREYCFGSMFRFNREGKFNIPYGGASYNDKVFHSKINNAFSRPIMNLLKNTGIYCLDFKEFFNKIDDQINENDFCFFDPPYDTDFSEYDKQSFGKNDHEDLAKIFCKLKCKGLMIIKKTDFIFDIYKRQRGNNQNIKIEEYSKNYSYNVRGRNKREVTHLLITNYKPPIMRCSGQLSFSAQL